LHHHSKKRAEEGILTQEERGHLYILKRLSWQDLIFLSFLVLSAIYVAFTLSSMKQLPGPLYGGDIYFHFSNVMHLWDGGSIFMSSQYLGEWQYYSWLLYALVWGAAKIFFISPMRAAILFPILIFAISLVVNYFLGQMIFRKKEIALIFAIACAFIPMSTPTSFSGAVLIPLMLFTFFLIFRKEFSIKNSIIAGLIYGVLGIGHTAAFMAINLFLILMLAAELISNKKKMPFKEIIKKYALMLAVGLPIALLYWGPLIFVYHGKTLNPWQEFAFYGSSGKGIFIFDTLKNAFFNFSGFSAVLISGFLITGIFSLFFSKTERNWLVPIIFLTGFIGLTHPYITEPLIHTSFGYYGFGSMIAIFRIILAFSGILFAYSYLKDSKIFFAVLAVIFIALFISSAVNFRKDQWVSQGYAVSDLTKIQFDFADYVAKSVSNEEVILTPHEETGFAINALTGKKILFMRRTHASPFVDFDQRAADGAIILYGNNSALRSELLKKYSIKYLYIDYYSAQSFAQCSAMWDNFSDPAYAEQSYSCIRVLPKYREYLNENGVETKDVYARLDIAFEPAERTNITIIKPVPASFSVTPLNAAQYQNQTFFVLYYINN
jgi:hypothetical protein